MRLLRFANQWSVRWPNRVVGKITYSMLDFTAHRLEKLDANLGTSRIIFNKENPGFS